MIHPAALSSGMAVSPRSCGRRSTNLVQLSTENSASSSPPCRSTIWRLTYRPRPISLPDGNNADINAAMLDLTTTNVTYNALVQTTSQRLSGLRNPINGARR